MAVFCNACGSQVQPQFNVCPNCGRPIAAAVALPSRLGRHFRTLGILWTIAGALCLIPAFTFTIVSRIARVALPATEEVGRTVGPVVLSIIGGLFFILATGGLLVGWGLLQRKPWGRFLAIVLGILSLIHPPFGTALGIYTLWVLLPDLGRTEYHRLAGAI